MSKYQITNTQGAGLGVHQAGESTMVNRYVIRWADGSAPVYFDEAKIEAMAERYGFDADAIEGAEVELRDAAGVVGWVMSGEPVVARDHGADLTEADLVRQWANCSQVRIDGERIWIEGPQQGHWLSDDKLAEYRAWRATTYPA